MTALFGSVRVVPGSGRLVRRPNAVLFTPEPDSGGLVAAFDKAPDDVSAVAAVQNLVVESNFQTPPFAVITWAEDAHFVVFGAVEVVTSLATVPMISGAGSGTWVERRVADIAAQAPVQISVNGGADEDSDLRLGVASSGGFELKILSAEPAPPVAAAQPAAAPTITEASTITAVADMEDDPTVQAPVVVPVQSGADTQADEESTVAGPAADRLVEAALCTDGHSNPPLTPSCRVCGLLVGTDVNGEAAAPSFISQPSLGRLVFADGSTVELDETMVIGRKPTSGQSGERTLAVAGEDVSRSHVRIIVRDWDVLITDLTSRNGTYLRVGDDPTPTRLDPGVEQLLEASTTIHLGSADIAFRFEQNW